MILAETTPLDRITGLIEVMAANVSPYLRVANRKEIVHLLEEIGDGEIPTIDETHPLFTEAMAQAFADFDPLAITGDEFEALAQYANDKHRNVPDANRVALDKHFDAFALQGLDSIAEESDSDIRLGTYDQLAAIASLLGRTLALSRQELLEQLDPTPEPDDDESYYSVSAQDEGLSDVDLDNMFETLVD